MNTEIATTDKDDRVRTAVARERERLLREAGLIAGLHFHRPIERPFTRAERGRVTLLFGGLSLRHDRLMQAAVEGLGYKAELVPVPNRVDFQTGREYCDAGLCNPTYFTVGALVNHLKRLRDERGIATERILSNYVFVTPGNCGPCRFGMYEAEYRLALRNAGFDGFRVIVFQAESKLRQSGAEAGLEMGPRFFLALINAALLADVLNAVAYHIRPYETEAGRTDEILDQCLAICQQSLRANADAPIRVGLLSRALSRLVGLGADDTALFLNQLTGTTYLAALEQCRRLIDAQIEVDYTRAKPIVKTVGEFWAQITEGDGNFRMFHFLEGEGAEVAIEPLTTGLNYTLTYWRQHAADRRGLFADAPRAWQLHRRLRRRLDELGKALVFRLAEWLLTREHERMRRALGGTVHPLANQIELQRLAHPYYNRRVSGGEAYLEVAKNIYYGNHRLAHMVLSLKPFGCMPSTQSDGAQAAVLAHYPALIFVPIETSGDGAVHAYSRVQMALGEAKLKCRDEFNAALARSGHSLEEIRAYVAEHRALRAPLQPVPCVSGVIGRAANFVLFVAGRMDRERAGRSGREHAGADVRVSQ